LEIAVVLSIGDGRRREVVFTVTALMDNGRAELPIESVTGNPGEKIYVAPEFLEQISK
jgi:hypothetical protein